MVAVVINEMGKRMKEQEAAGDDNHSLSSHKKARLVWSDDLHAKFIAAVNELGLHKAVPKKIVTLMNVQGITTAHVASHLQKYRLRVKKAAAHKLPSTLTQSQNTNIHPSYNFPPVHQSHTDQFYSRTGFNMCGVSPSTLIQSQNINNNSLNIHPPPSTFPTHSQNIHPSYNFPLSQTSTLLLPNNVPLHHSHTLPNTQIYSPTASTLLRTYVGSTSSKSTSIWDDDWLQKFMKRKPGSLQFSHNSLPVLESDKTSQINNSHNVELLTVGSATSLEDKNIDISDYNLCSENSPIDFSIEETNCDTLEWECLEEDLINVWRCLEEENVLNVML